jgi:formylglycine-generating enzyme required for sulfatase activity
MSLPSLRDLLAQHFNLEELEQLCFDLNIEYEDVPGSTRKAKAQALVEYCLRHNRLPDLSAYCRQLRPDVNWPDTFPLTSVDNPLTTYCHQTIAELSAPRYQLDHRFVRLTLLLDQGAETQGIRFVPDTKRGKYDSLATLLGDIDERALVLLGRPGSGKTTLLRRLQLEMAWTELEQAGEQVAFFVPLNSYRGARVADAPPDPYTWLAQEWQLRQPNLPDFAMLFQAGRLRLLLDGLNELPHRDQADYEERVTLWQHFLQRATPLGNTLLFSCRSLDYSVPLNSEMIPVRQVQVEPLAPSQIEEFLILYLGERADEVWQALRQDNQQLSLFATPFFLRLLADQVMITGELLTSRVALLTGFVRRAMYREIQERHHRLFRPGQLLTANDVQQVIHNRWANPVALPQQGVLLPKLEQLAFAMQDNRSANEAGQVRIPEETAHSLLNHPLVEEIVAAAIQLNVLDKDLTRLEITYLHQLLQEYFAARVLAQEPDPARLAVPWQGDIVKPALAELMNSLEVSEPLPALPTTGWEETTLLAAAMTANSEQFVSELIAANLPLAARCAAAPEVQVSSRLVAKLQQALIERIGDPQADLRARIAAAEALGELGDPRFEQHTGPHGDYLLPPLVSIPAGTYTIGNDRTQYDDEKPAHAVEIAAFAMGIFPVTNSEYRLFIEAGGYEDERWWETEAARAWVKGETSSAGARQAGRDMQKYLQDFSEDVIRQQKASPDQIEFWLWLKNAPSEEVERQYEKWYPSGKIYRQPEYWDDSRFNRPTQPVVGVTWFEARAYCAWLSAQSGDSYRLPTETEWEAAARGQAGREYAYGDRYDNGRCNTFETHMRRTTPVGVFPGGYTPEGIADLSGNVWEWTTTIWGNSLNRPDFAYPYVATDGREDVSNATVRRVVRGGSWGDYQRNARAAFRLHSPPDYRNFYGFRVVGVRRSPSR